MQAPQVALFVDLEKKWVLFIEETRPFASWGLVSRQQASKKAKRKLASFFYFIFFFWYDGRPPSVGEQLHPVIDGALRVGYVFTCEPLLRAARFHVGEAANRPFASVQRSAH